MFLTLAMFVLLCRILVAFHRNGIIFEPYERLLPSYESALNLQLNRSHIQITPNDAQELQCASSFVLDATISTTSQTNKQVPISAASSKVEGLWVAVE